VLESDDWGLCAWSADEQAHRVLAGLPAFRQPAGLRYAGSTLESAADVQALADSLGDFRGADGFPPVLQANMVMAAPDYERLHPPLFEEREVPLVEFPATPSRWQRPGVWDAVERARHDGVWWPELHGLHHIPELAWLTALRRNVDDARRAFEHQTAVCTAVEASGEYDPSEPKSDRLARLERAMALFTKLVGRRPWSFCPPDYRWDDVVETHAVRHGLRVFQGKGEQHGMRFRRARRWWLRRSWPGTYDQQLYMPPRIAFEPRTPGPLEQKVGVEAALHAARAAWSRGQPAVISSHRVNYVHLEPGWSEGGRARLRDLLARLTGDGAVFLVDIEVRQLLERSWCMREIGDRFVLVRYYGVPGEPIRFAAPSGTTGISLREGRGSDGAEVALDHGTAIARLGVGEYLMEWT
jgi:hypothetical protein